MKSAVAINIISSGIDWNRACPNAERIARRAARAALAVGIESAGLASLAGVELGITLTDDARQRRLNRRFRGQNASTNVLAFRAWEPGAQTPPGAPLLLGDVVLAFETVVREADERRRGFVDHFCHLIVHGILHLLGCDHQTEAEAASMEHLETLTLATLGVPDPHHESTGSIEPDRVYP